MQRRLVKSPPELWELVSSEETLGRHLAEFGEIRITRVEPETTVAWEGDRASGTVEISPTGWGTKVTITATPVAEAVIEAEAPTDKPAVEPGPEPLAFAVPVEPEPFAIEPEPFAIEPEPFAIEPEPVPIEPEPEPFAIEPEPEPRAAATISLRGSEPDPEPEPEPEVEPAPLGFFARFFRRQSPPPAPPDRAEQFRLPIHHAEIPTPGPPPSDPSPPAPVPEPTPLPPAPDPSPPAPEPPPLEPDPTPPSIERPPEPPPVAAEVAPDAPPGSSPLDSERTAAILSEVLDDLGAAHHRPFSRG